MIKYNDWRSLSRYNIIMITEIVVVFQIDDSIQIPLPSRLLLPFPRLSLSPPGVKKSENHPVPHHNNTQVYAENR